MAVILLTFLEAGGPAGEEGGEKARVEEQSMSPPQQTASIEHLGGSAARDDDLLRGKE